MKNTIDIPGRTFVDFFRAIEHVAPECRLVIENGVLHVKTVDAANVMLIDIMADVSSGLDAQAPDVTRKEPPIVIGISVEDMTRFSKIVSGTDLITMSWDGEIVTMETGNAVAHTKLQDINTMRKEPTGLSIPTTAAFPVENLRVAKFLRDASYDGCRITVKDGRATLVSKTETGDIGITTHGSTGEATCLYSCNYLLDIVKAFPFSRSIMELATDRVLKVSVVTGQINAMWLLAPRIETV